MPESTTPWTSTLTQFCSVESVPSRVMPIFMQIQCSRGEQPYPTDSCLCLARVRTCMQTVPPPPSPTMHLSTCIVLFRIPFKFSMSTPASLAALIRRRVLHGQWIKPSDAHVTYVLPGHTTYLPHVMLPGATYLPHVMFLGPHIFLTPCRPGSHHGRLYCISHGRLLPIYQENMTALKIPPTRSNHRAPMQRSHHGCLYCISHSHVLPIYPGEHQHEEQAPETNGINLKAVMYIPGAGLIRMYSHTQAAVPSEKA